MVVWGRNPQGPLSPLYTPASPNLNGLNPNVTVGRNSVGIADRDRHGRLEVGTRQSLQVHTVHLP
jgi:hypothetical protein